MKIPNKIIEIMMQPHVDILFIPTLDPCDKLKRNSKALKVKYIFPNTSIGDGCFSSFITREAL